MLNKRFMLSAALAVTVFALNAKADPSAGERVKQSEEVNSTDNEQEHHEETETERELEKAGENEDTIGDEDKREVESEVESEGIEKVEDEDFDDDLFDKSDAEMLEALEEGAREEAAERAEKQGPPTGRVQRFFQSMNPDISVIATFLAAYTYDTALRGNGHQVARDLDMKNGIHLQELEFAFQAAVDPYFRMDVFLAFDTSGVEVEEAYFTSLSLPWRLQARAGIMNLRFGRQNPLHLHDYNFVDNMLPNVRFLSDESMRAATGELSWLLPIPWYAALSFSISNPDGADTPSFVGDGDRSEDFEVKDHRHLLYNNRLDQFFPMGTNVGLNLGMSYAVGPNATDPDKNRLTHLVGADMYLKWRPLYRPYLEMGLTAEGFYRRIEHAEGELQDWGAYVQMLWRLSQRWWLGLRYDMVVMDDVRQLIEFDFEEPPDEKHPFALDDQHRGTAAITWRPTEFSQIRLQYNYNHVRQSAEDGLPTGWKSVHEVFVQLMGNLGTHGAHPY